MHKNLPKNIKNVDNFFKNPLKNVRLLTFIKSKKPKENYAINYFYATPFGFI